MNKGWKESFSALGVAIGLGICIALVVMLLAGCSGTRVLAEYEHHSSIPDYYDLNTSDTVGLTFTTPLRFKPDQCDLYCPELEVSASWEVTGKPVFGASPVGAIRLRAPIWVRE